MLESAERKKVIDVFNYVQLIRTNRISMVQTEVSLVIYLRAIKISNFSKDGLFEDNVSTILSAILASLLLRIPSVIVTLLIYAMCS